MESATSAGAGRWEQNQDEDTGKAADRHDSFQRDVDDTASLGEHTAHRNEHQNNGVQ